MVSRSIELSQSESTVLAVITKQVCISVTEICYHINFCLTEREVESAISVLERHRLVVLSSSGSCPKRWKIRQTAKPKQQDLDCADEYQDPVYDQESVVEGPVEGETIVS